MCGDRPCRFALHERIREEVGRPLSHKRTIFNTTRSAVLGAFCANRLFEFQKRSQFFIGTHHETLSVHTIEQ
jgi:hypothetical protein